MAVCMEKEGVGFYARQGWAGGDGVWEWDSRTPVSPDSQPTGSWRELRVKVGCEAGWRMRKEEPERKQQQRQQWRRSQVQQDLGGSCTGGSGRRKNLLVGRHHRRRCKRTRELDMGGGGLTVSHPASATIVV